MCSSVTAMLKQEDLDGLTEVHIFTVKNFMIELNPKPQNPKTPTIKNLISGINEINSQLS